MLQWSRELQIKKTFSSSDRQQILPTRGYIGICYVCVCVCVCVWGGGGLYGMELIYIYIYIHLHLVI